MLYIVIPWKLTKCPAYDMPNFEFKIISPQLDSFTLATILEWLPVMFCMRKSQACVNDAGSKSIIELLVQTQNRLPDNILVLMMLKSLTPSVALGQDS
jgi:hypothetical protein